MDPQAHGKVLKVFSETTVLVSLGTGTDPAVRDGFGLVGFELGEEVTDPESGESLGRIEWVKARLVVTRAQARMSVAETPSRTETKTVRNPTASSVAIAAAIAGVSSYETKEVTHTVQESFKVDATLVEPPKVDLRVKPGDAVRVVD